MVTRPSWPTLPNTFLGLDSREHSLEASTVVLLPVPYDATTSYKTGSREGPPAIIRASRQMEDYDAELGTCPCDIGIHTAEELEQDAGGPEAMAARVSEAVGWYAAQGKLVGMLGGEHSLTPGAVRAVAKHYPDLSILWLDAQADLRDSYQGAAYSHASAARRTLEHAQVTLVGVRSMTAEEAALIQDEGLPYFPRGSEEIRDVNAIVESLRRHVYISFDLDAFDPSLMPAVGTPEPGGLGWWEVLRILRAVAEHRTIVGFDVMELAPAEGPETSAYTAAKLVYKIIGYATKGKRGRL